MTRDEAIASIRGKLEGLGARIKELEVENAELQRIVFAQAVQIGSLQEDAERINRLEAICWHGEPGAWSTVLIALRSPGYRVPLREAIDAALKGGK